MGVHEFDKTSLRVHHNKKGWRAVLQHYEIFPYDYETKLRKFEMCPDLLHRLHDEDYVLNFSKQYDASDGFFTNDSEMNW